MSDSFRSRRIFRRRNERLVHDLWQHSVRRVCPSNATKSSIWTMNIANHYCYLRPFFSTGIMTVSSLLFAKRTTSMGSSLLSHIRPLKLDLTCSPRPIKIHPFVSYSGVLNIHIIINDGEQPRCSIVWLYATEQDSGIDGPIGWCIRKNEECQTTWAGTSWCDVEAW